VYNAELAALSEMRYGRQDTEHANALQRIIENRRHQEDHEKGRNEPGANHNAPPSGTARTKCGTDDAAKVIPRGGYEDSGNSGNKRPGSPV